MTVRELLDGAAREISESTVDDRLVIASFQAVIGEAYLGIGELGPARKHLNAALEVLLAEWAATDERALKLRTVDVRLLFEEGRFPELERAARSLHRDCLAALGPDHELTIDAAGHLRGVLQMRGEPVDRRLQPPEFSRRARRPGVAAREQELREEIERTRNEHGDKDPELARQLYQLAPLLRNERRLDEARACFEEAIAINAHAFGADHPRTHTLKMDYALVLGELGHDEQAEQLLIAGLSKRREAFEETSPALLHTLGTFSRFLRERGRYDELEPLCAQMVDICEKSFGENSPRTLNQRLQCAVYSAPDKRLALATAELDEIIEQFPGAPLIRLVSNTVRMLARIGEPSDAEAFVRHALSLFEKSPDFDRRDTLVLTGHIIHLQLRSERREEADDLSAAGLEEVRARFGDDDALVVAYAALRGRWLVALGRDEEAEPLLIEARQRAGFGPRDWRAGWTLWALYERAGRLDEAQELRLQLPHKSADGY